MGSPLRQPKHSIRSVRVVVAAMICAGATVSGAGIVGPRPGGVVAAAVPWPGGQTVAEVDVANTFGANLSGLDYEDVPAAPDVLWGVNNSPGMLYRIVDNGTNWVRDTANGWAA